MDAMELLNQIEAQVTAASDLVLVHVLDQIGPCSYAAYLPAYVHHKTRFHQTIGWMDRWGDEYLTVAEFLDRAIPCEPQAYGSEGSSRAEYHRERAEYYHNLMYEQPCLLCEICQRRKKPWLTPRTNPCASESIKRLTPAVQSSPNELSDISSRLKSSVGPI